MKNLVTVDFETFGIEDRPAYPPKPVGVSIKHWGKAPRYYAWGHPEENNCTEREGLAALKQVWKKNGPSLLFQNAKFDLDVGEVHLGLPMPKWEDVHDTLFLIFLDDPNQQTFSLKPTAARLLNMPPEEQDAVGEWLMEHQPVEGVRISRSPNSPHYFGRYIAYAPGKLVGKYANGDVIRTEKLFAHLMTKTSKRGMEAAYNRERRLMPHLLAMERRGVPVDQRRLEKDLKMYHETLERIDAWLRQRLRVTTETNLDSGDQLFAALRKAKLINRKAVTLTASGKPSTSKDALIAAVKDSAVTGVLRYRAQLHTCVRTFMEPWAETARAAVKAGKVDAEMRRLGRSLIYAQWNQVKGDARGGSHGARTGRLSSTPTNLMAIPKAFSPIFRHEEPKTKTLPLAPLKLPPLPLVRRYVVPFPGCVFNDRDYSQQEPRILAHFDGGAILKMYTDDPWMDFHDKVRDELAKRGLHYERRPVKNTGLGLIYGMGVGRLAEKNGMDVEEASRLKQSVLKLLPGLKEMYAECRARAKENRPVRTWGGREYYCEPPKLVDGRLRQFDYKLVNVIVQGSAADCTKEAIIAYCESRCAARSPLVLNVHDQLTSSATRKYAREDMETLRLAMEGVKFDVQMLTEGSTGENWADLVDTDKRGKRVDTRRAA